MKNELEYISTNLNLTKMSRVSRHYFIFKHVVIIYLEKANEAQIRHLPRHCQKFALLNKP